MWSQRRSRIPTEDDAYPVTLGIRKLEQPVTVSQVYNDVAIAHTTDQSMVLIENSERTVLRKIENSTAA